MNEPGPGDAVTGVTLATLREQGAEPWDPVRFRYLEQLAQRTQAAAGPVQQVLAARLEAALADHATRWQAARDAAADELTTLAARHPERARELRRLHAAGDYPGMRRLGARVASASGAQGGAPAPLVALNQSLRNIARAAGEAAPARPGAPVAELKSVQRFRETWSRISAEAQVDQALGRGPDNAGPLNSHRLVLHSLARMRELSPDYLRRFLAQFEALQWLEQAGQRPVQKPVAKAAPAEVKPARRGRVKK